MPPKPKFTREEIVQTALDVVSRRGVEALTAKELGEAIGSSARPIFTVFSSMKEVRDAVRAAAMQRFYRFASFLSAQTLLFKYIRKLLHHGKRRMIAPIADTPGKTIDEDLSCAAAVEINAVVVMIQINVKPITCVIAFRPICTCQRPERTVVGVAGENVHDLCKLWRISRISFLCGYERVVLGSIDAKDCNGIAFRLQVCKAVRPKHITSKAQ